MLPPRMKAAPEKARRASPTRTRGHHPLRQRGPKSFARAQASSVWIERVTHAGVGIDVPLRELLLSGGAPGRRRAQCVMAIVAQGGMSIW